MIVQKKVSQYSRLQKLYTEYGLDTECSRIVWQAKFESNCKTGTLVGRGEKNSKSYIQM